MTRRDHVIRVPARAIDVERWRAHAAREHISLAELVRRALDREAPADTWEARDSTMAELQSNPEDPMNETPTPPWIDTTVRGLRPDTLWHLLLSLPGGPARARQVDEANPQDEHYTEGAVHEDAVDHVLAALDDMPTECATAVALMAEEVDRLRRQRALEAKQALAQRWDDSGDAIVGGATEW